MGIRLRALAAPLVLCAACGSRTGLEEGASPPGDAAALTPSSAAPGGGSSGGVAGGPPPVDAAVYERLPPIQPLARDGGLPSGCADAPTPLVYVLTEDAKLYSFDPGSLTFALVGPIQCPAGASTPYSMAVERRGMAFSVFSPSGALFRLSTTTGACQPTAFAPGQEGFTLFGMGYAGGSSGTGERLYVAQNVYGGLSTGLAWIDVGTLVLHTIGPFDLPVPRPELTGTSDGRLFMFFSNETGAGSHVAEVDPTTAAVIAQDDLELTSAGAAHAFALWGGVFWLFTSYGPPSTVTRFDPVTRQASTVAAAPGEVVGAGVSTCAP